MFLRVARVAVTTTVPAAVGTAVLGSIGVLGEAGRGGGGSGLLGAVLFGALHLCYVLPVFWAAAALARAAHRRGGAAGGVLGCVLLLGTPLLFLPPAFVIENGAGLACYLVVLYASGYVRLLRIATFVPTAGPPAQSQPS